MALSNKFISLLTQIINEQMVDTHISKITMLNETDFMISKSKNCQEKLFISLNNREPLITLCRESKQFIPSSNNFVQKLKKEIENGRVILCEKINNDRIIHFNISKTSETYKKIFRHLYIELIPNQANLILTDENNKIILCYRQIALSPNGRLLVNGVKYEEPLSQNACEFSTFEQEQIKKYYQNGKIIFEIGLDNNLYSAIKTPTSQKISPQTLYDNYYINMETKHRKEVSNEVVLSITHHNKSLKKKLNNLKSEKKLANNYMTYKEYADMILTYQNELSIQDDYILINDYKIPCNSLLTPLQTANEYYRKYQKMKRSIAHLEEQIKITEDKITYFETLQNQLENSNDADLKGIEFELAEQGYINKRTIKSKHPHSNGMSQPYYFTIDNVKIGFGKNNLQNNYLTFSLAKPQHYFLHTKNKPGSHVIIFDENPSNKVKEYAAMIALINSHLDDGEVQITKKKNVKKINSLGKVSLSSYETVYIREIDSDLKESIKVLKKN